MENCSKCDNTFKMCKTLSSNGFVLIDPSDSIAEYIELFQDHNDTVVHQQYNDDTIQDIYNGRSYKKFLNNLNLKNIYTLLLHPIVMELRYSNLLQSLCGQHTS